MFVIYSRSGMGLDMLDVYYYGIHSHEYYVYCTYVYTMVHTHYDMLSHYLMYVLQEVYKPLTSCRPSPTRWVVHVSWTSEIMNSNPTRSSPGIWFIIHDWPMRHITQYGVTIVWKNICYGCMLHQQSMITKHTSINHTEDSHATDRGNIHTFGSVSFKIIRSFSLFFAFSWRYLLLVKCILYE